MEIAIVQFDGRKVTETFSTLLQPGTKVQPYVAALTGISDQMLSHAPTFADVAHIIDAMTRDRIVVAHNLLFDMQILRSEFGRLDMEFDRDGLCTDKLSRSAWPERKRYNLGSLCKMLDIPYNGKHRAKNDALATVHLLEHLLFKVKMDIKTKKGASLEALRA